MNKYLKIILGGSLLMTGCSGTSPKLGLEAGNLKPCPESPNCVNSQAQDEEHSIKPFKLTGSIPEVKKKLTQAIELLDNSKVVVSDSNYIRAEFTSSLFRFVDDVEFYFPGSDSAETIVHVRSASRLGHSDLGVNRKRIESIRSKLK